MATPSRDPAACEAAYQAWVNSGWNYAVAARATQMDRMTFKRHVWESESFKALSPAELPEGMEARTVSTIVDKQGQVVRQSVVAKTHPGDVELVDGMEARAITIQQDGQGRVTQQWIKKAKQAPSAAEIMQVVLDAAEAYNAPTDPLPAARNSHQDKLFVLPCTDWHIGSCYRSVDKKLAWGTQDTISDIRSAVMRLFASAPPAEECLIQGLGDLSDYDSCSPVTPKNRHLLEVDMSPLEMVAATQDLLIWIVDMARRYFGKVRVNMVRGNHDETVTLCHLGTLRAHFRNEPRVSVDFTDDPYNALVHGQVMYFAAHGDDLKAASVPAFMASNYPKEWGKTTRRIAITGHRHHKEKLKEDGGVEVISLPAMVRSNRYARTAGYVSGRGMQSMTIDKSGDIETNQVDFR
jgi:hypothetical protein